MRCAGRLPVTVLFVTLGLALSCAGSPPRAYEGGKRPRSEVARITTGDKGPRDPIPKGTRYDSFIVAVDGAERNITRQLDVLPGKREIVVLWRRFEGDPMGAMGYGQWLKREEGRETFQIDAKAGGNYWIKITNLPPKGPPAMRVSEN
ncbi:MAG: hypothetical protein V3T86_01915 [Planctomycetota bacterium]